jgi:hypothetical protein
MSNELERFKQALLKSVKQMRQSEAARCFGADIAGLGAGAARADRSRQDLVEGRIRTPGSAFETRTLMHEKRLQPQVKTSLTCSLLHLFKSRSLLKTLGCSSDAVNKDMRFN